MLPPRPMARAYPLGNTSQAESYARDLLGRALPEASAVRRPRVRHQHPAQQGGTPEWRSQERCAAPLRGGGNSRVGPAEIQSDQHRTARSLIDRDEREASHGFWNAAPGSIRTEPAHAVGF